MLFDLSIALRLRRDLSKVIAPTPRSGACETWVPLGPPPTRLTAVPNKWVQPTRRPADLLVGPTDLVGSPHDLLKTFQKIPQTRRQLGVQDKAVQSD
jgi:hypothetical protein